MSKFIVSVDQINCMEGLCVVTFNLNGLRLSMVSLDLDPKIKTGMKCLLSVNPSHVAIGKEFSGMLSYSNQLPAKIISIEEGQLLARIVLDILGSQIESLITATSCKRLNLQTGEMVTALIKASELSIVEVIS